MIPIHPRYKQFLVELVLESPLRVTDISKRTGTNYAHVFNISKYFEKLGVIEKEKKGRETFMHITPHGIKFYNFLSEKRDNKKTKVKK